MKTVLITGANSGLGLESARQLASGDSEWTRILLGTRSVEKGEAARADLVSTTGRPPSDFGIVVLDLHDHQGIRASIGALGEPVDAVIMNGGGKGRLDEQGLPRRTGLGLSETFSMNVGGHAVLVQALLDAGFLREGATLLFVGSEGSRGIKPMRIASPTLPKGLGDLDLTLKAVAEGTHASKGYDAIADYGLVKLIGTAWMAQFQREHEGKFRALTVSPGMTSGTEGIKARPAIQRFMITKVLFPLFGLMGHAHDLKTGAARYVEVLNSDRFEGGGFYASGGRGTTGPLKAQTPEFQPLLGDVAFQAAVGRLIHAHVVPASSTPTA
jgi:NAD(P)-dependent dehydrogenase (short-subunit alcohol dehydrogenase family)